MFVKIPRSLAVNIVVPIWCTEERSTLRDIFQQSANSEHWYSCHAFAWLYAMCHIVIVENKDHTSVDLCLLCLNVIGAKWLMPDNVSLSSLYIHSLTHLLWLCVFNRANHKKFTQPLRMRVEKKKRKDYL